ncbi:MAG: hypothetical protein U1F66_06960 [bacterium]
MKKIFYFLVVLCCAASPLRAQVLEQTFNDEEAFFRISTPNGQWSFDPRGVDPGPLRLTIHYEAPVYQFVPNVTVRVQELDSPKTKLERFLKQDLAALPATVELVEKKKIVHAGLDGYQVVLHDKESKAVFHQWIFIAKGRSFVITCTSNVESYTRMRKDFLKILESFEVT